MSVNLTRLKNAIIYGDIDELIDGVKNKFSSKINLHEFCFLLQKKYDRRFLNLIRKR
jgi:hypothetical protein